MILLFRMFEKQMLLLMLVIGLFLWGLTSSIQLFLKSDKTIILRVDDYQTNIIGENESLPIEVENFINHFVGLFYSYTSQNYENHIDRAIFFLEKDLVLKFSPNLNSMLEKIQKDPTLQATTISKISRVKEGDYEVFLEVYRKTGEVEKEDKYRLRVSIRRTQRSLENPYGLLIAKLEEYYD